MSFDWQQQVVGLLQTIITSLGGGGGEPVPATITSVGVGAHTDAFQRLRVSTPHILFSAVHDYDARPDLYREQLDGGAASAFNSDGRCVSMTVSSNGDKVTRQSRLYFPYRTANSMLLFFTFAMNGHQDGVRMRVGAFDDDDGLFLERDEDGDYLLVVRTSTSGSPVETRIPQASWNVDTLDGSGDDGNPSGIDLDLTNSQIFVIDYQWLGVGTVRFAFDMDGELVVVHQQHNSNRRQQVYMKTGTLPVRYEAEAVSEPAAPASLYHICVSVLREGDTVETGVPRAVDNDLTRVTVDTGWTPVLGVRLQSGVKTELLYSSAMMTHADEDDIQAKLVLNPTITGATPSWVAKEIEEYAVGTGAMVVTDWEYAPQTGYVVGGTRQAADTVNKDSSFGAVGASVGIDGTPDELWIIARSSAGTIDVLAAMNYLLVR